MTFTSEKSCNEGNPPVILAKGVMSHRCKSGYRLETTRVPPHGAQCSDERTVGETQLYQTTAMKVQLLRHCFNKLKDFPVRAVSQRRKKSWTVTSSTVKRRKESWSHFFAKWPRACKVPADMDDEQFALHDYPVQIVFCF